MPPKKKRTQKARKAELLFLERPREGPVRCYEAPLLSTENPRRVPTQPVDQNTSAAWVCPQFETAKSMVLKKCQKHHGPCKPQNWDASHSLPYAGGACRRATACKFPPLTFENPEGHAVQPLNCPNHMTKNRQCSHSQSKKGRAAKANIQANSPENYREIHSLPTSQSAEPEAFSPPEVETPQMPPMRNSGCSTTLPQTSSNDWHSEKELAFGVDLCGRGESAAVLVTDTPERDYGVKVTWRRRPQLMKYLRETG
ncbi:RHNO1 protein, partial [Ceuthmochares aereus]|nr:RHNO1 protein [Ceuthmochares aereus]